MIEVNPVDLIYPTSVPIASTEIVGYHPAWLQKSGLSYFIDLQNGGAEIGTTHSIEMRITNSNGCSVECEFLLRIMPPIQVTHIVDLPTTNLPVDATAICVMGTYHSTGDLLGGGSIYRRESAYCDDVFYEYNWRIGDKTPVLDGFTPPICPYVDINTNGEKGEVTISAADCNIPPYMQAPGFYVSPQMVAALAMPSYSFPLGDQTGKVSAKVLTMDAEGSFRTTISLNDFDADENVPEGVLTGNYNIWIAQNHESTNPNFWTESNVDYITEDPTPVSITAKNPSISIDFDGDHIVAQISTLPAGKTMIVNVYKNYVLCQPKTITTGGLHDFENCDDNTSGSEYYAEIFLSGSPTSCKTISNIVTLERKSTDVNDVHFAFLYPNPARDVVTLRYDLGEPARLELVDPLGRTLVRRKLTDVAAELELDLTGLAAGVYVCRLTTKSGAERALRLIIDR